MVIKNYGDSSLTSVPNSEILQFVLKCCTSMLSNGYKVEILYDVWKV